LAIRSIDLALLFSGWNQVCRQSKSRRSFEVKIKTWTVGFAVLTLVTAPAFAETGLGQRSYDQNIVPVGCESCDTGCCDDDCCGDPCCGDPCCGDGVAATGLLSGMGPGIVEGFSLAGALGIDALDIGGWTSMGWTDDAIPLSTPGTSGEGLSFRDVPNRFNLDQQWFYIGKEADGSNGIGFGGRFDVLYGVDAQKTQSFGNPPDSFDEGWDHGVYGWAIPQLYGEVAVGDFSVKIGHFFTTIGYEVVPVTGNFFYSHSLTQFNSEPFTHTGVLSAYTGFEGFTLYNGWTLGWDTGFDQVNSGNNYLGGFGVNVSDAIVFTYMCTYGNFGARDGGDRNSYSHSVLATVGLTDSLNYVIQSDLVDADDVGTFGTPGFIENNQLGINQYLFYGVNDWLKAGTRIEWWKNGGVSHYECTGGVNISLLGNLIVRPEYRQDWAPGLDESFENMACDMILTY
jgi:hypothetical protein